MSRPIRVELLRYEGCPLAAAARRVVDEWVREVGVDAIVTEQIAQYPSPSVLVDRIDVMGSPAGDAPVDACRVRPRRAEYRVDEQRCLAEIIERTGVADRRASQPEYGAHDDGDADRGGKQPQPQRRQPAPEGQAGPLST